MLKNEECKLSSDADGRSIDYTERDGAEIHTVRQTVPNGGPGDREGPAADGRQFFWTAPADDWSEQSGGSVDQADRRHEPVD